MCHNFPFAHIIPAFSFLPVKQLLSVHSLTFLDELVRVITKDHLSGDGEVSHTLVIFVLPPSWPFPKNFMDTSVLGGLMISILSMDGIGQEEQCGENFQVPVPGLPSEGRAVQVEMSL